MPLIRVEVVYATPDRQTLLESEVELGATVMQSVIASGVTQAHPEIDLDTADFGIWSERVSPDSLVRNGDRVEIYRPLIADPKQVRRQRAKEGKLRRAKRD